MPLESISSLQETLASLDKEIEEHEEVLINTVWSIAAASESASANITSKIDTMEWNAWLKAQELRNGTDEQSFVKPHLTTTVPEHLVAMSDQTKKNTEEIFKLHQKARSNDNEIELENIIGTRQQLREQNLNIHQYRQEQKELNQDQKRKYIKVNDMLKEHVGELELNVNQEEGELRLKNSNDVHGMTDIFNSF
ncbi:uncharacterized protein LOC131265874 [Anopheles coustani]|uniref:uncharacterized protein LOC131265874 n=1 Tax=Anopheles coustani TaxID=139045 RepID=UPI00265B3B73|nr:uncharacterized protein LOC131265874 [Anopheles coustani]